MLSTGASFTTLLKGGVYGVDIFFVLSGFLISSLLLREFHAFGKIDFKAFYLRRALRLLPAMALLLAGCAVHVLFFKPLQSQFDFIAIALSALYISNFVLIFAGVRLGMLTPTWSLSVEEQFYSIWPLCMSFLARLKARRAFELVLAMIVGALLLRVFLNFLYFKNGYWPLFGAANHFLLARADALLYGVAVAIAAFAGWLPAGRGDPLWRTLTWGAAVLLGVMLFFAPSEPSVFYFFYACAGVLTAILIAGLITSPPKPLMALLTWAPLVWVGRISYGLYLYHVPAFALAQWPALSFLSPQIAAYATYAIAVALAFAIAATSFYLVERRFLDLKHRVGLPRAAVRASLAVSS